MLRINNRMMMIGYQHKKGEDGGYGNKLQWIGETQEGG